MIIVCSLADQKSVCLSVNASHLISVVDPGYEPETPHSVKNHLKLGFDDIVEISNENPIYRLAGFSSKQILPNKNHINKIINFVKTWDQSRPIVIHCWCGVSRSMATALFLLCKINSKNVDKNVRFMRSIAPHANPNKLMVSIFEKYLEIDGQIINAIKKYPHTISYDCETTFAPVTIFKIKELRENFR
jgi:predicted protein tyrosine phosphatase